MTPQEFALCEDLRQRDLEAEEARHRRCYRAKAWLAVACLLACFWIAALGGCWAWAEQPFPNNDSLAAAGEGE